MSRMHIPEGVVDDRDCKFEVCRDPIDTTEQGAQT